MTKEIEHYAYFSMDFQFGLHNAIKFPDDFVGWLNSLDEDTFLEVYNYTMYNYAALKE